MTRSTRGFAYCPKCRKGTPSVTRDSRGVELNGLPIIRRRRECHHCGHRWNTAEIPVSVLDDLARATSRGRVE